MKEIIGDDYPTYEDSVNMTLAEQKNKPNYTYMTEIEQQITNDNLERLLLENAQLRHRLACVKDDIEIIDRHIQNNCNKRFKRPSRSKDGSVFAEEAWHNITNIEIACDLSDESVDEWGSDMAEEYRKHMESSADYLNKYKAKK
jgi:cobalamin biosynthesis protein CobT